MRVSMKMQKTIEKLATKHGVDLAKPYAYMKLQLSFYMPLVVYNSGDNRVSVMHVNSNHMADPEIVFWIGSSAGWMPIEVTQLIGGRRVYALPNDDATAIVPISHRRQASLTDFAELWASNLIDQGWLEQSEQTGRMAGCESTNHDQCYGELWQCAACHKTVCYAEGTDDHRELCDDCWVRHQEENHNERVSLP